MTAGTQEFYIWIPTSACPPQPGMTGSENGFRNRLEVDVLLEHLACQKRGGQLFLTLFPTPWRESNITSPGCLHWSIIPFLEIGDSPK